MTQIRQIFVIVFRSDLSRLQHDFSPPNGARLWEVCPEVQASEIAFAGERGGERLACQAEWLASGLDA